MTDDFADLKKALAARPPAPPADAARERALGAAMQAFDTETEAAREAAAEHLRAQDEKVSANLQGTEEAPRQRVRQSGLMTLFRRLAMTFSLPSTKTLMMGGASLAVMAIAVVAVQQQMDRPLFDDGVSLSETKAPGGGMLDLMSSGPRTETAARPAPAAADAEASRTEAQPAPPSPARTGGSLQSLDARGLVAKDRSRAELRIGQPLRASPSDVTIGQPVYEEQGRDQFEEFEPNRLHVTAEDPVSTFSIDVDTASYAFMRASLMNGVLPQKDAVRVEELINYFPYDYAVPESREVPFSSDVTIMQTPWNENTRLMRIGIQGYELEQAEKPRSNLVFLIDTSGSMNNPDKLPLLVNSFKLLLETLGPEDTVSIVVYAGSAGTVLEPTKASETTKIMGALDRLQAGGSTAGGEGIRQAYQLAEQSFDKDGINRVILATDGDFNVGISNPDELQDFVERKRESGVFLSVLGFGRGNYNDRLMQALAQNGNGNAAYIDTLSEARKTLVEEASSTLFPIAKDVKIQVEFNPATIAEYRLIGYETRVLNREDFNNDKVDAGDIGAGHAVTALYELTPTDAEARQIDSLRYETTQKPVTGDLSDEYAFVKIRYKAPDADESQLIETPVTRADEVTPDTEARFAAAVAAFAQLLRGGRYTGDFTYEDVIALANGAKGEDPFGYRAEFVNLARLAKSAAALAPQQK